jgi:hypothetical protein
MNKNPRGEMAEFSANKIRKAGDSTVHQRFGTISIATCLSKLVGNVHQRISIYCLGGRRLVAMIGTNNHNVHHSKSHMPLLLCQKSNLHLLEAP